MKVTYNWTSFSNYFQKKKKSAFFISIGLFAVLTLGIFQYQANAVTLYRVYLDGKEIGTVNDKAVIEKWIDEQLDEKKEQYGNINLALKNDITYKVEKKYKGKFDNAKTLSALKDSLSFKAEAVAVNVDGKLIGFVKDQATVEKILNDIKNSYISNQEKNKVVAASNNIADKNVEVKNIEIKENISTKVTQVLPEQIMSESMMQEILQKGTLEEKQYVVKEGDTISEIAAAHGLTTAQIYQLNPDIKGELIRIGDVLNVTALTPYVTVKTSEIVTQIETIPYKVIYRNDSSMYINERKTIQEGKEGKKKVKYSIVKENGIVIEKNVIDTVVIEEEKDKIVLRGIKIPQVQSTGVFSWPTVGGVITSKYGPRWGTTHKGIDIAGVSDYTIKAPDNGVVTYAGWVRGYGNTIIINHGKGITTLYGHLDKILVKIGDVVAKNQKIGIMGNTGWSTGTHLHFEVKVNNVAKDPLSFLEGR
ncbi:hypothetical protein BHF71_00200 [Vulcanibacillus modesticaldus]|uniref:Peptidase M23 n=1 Tax=Vulcanibacillus modesticaldus TaxID=337097 RepID=A0A1D2YX75_9BACI|nr:peptidoglycan DD-metalloendopeptidase family protein [Vulcanibacillus modesticaldus]OEG00365.1 hypothetical protein BHF71_00200 [Vulcanibacillus modesticaldus]